MGRKHFGLTPCGRTIDYHTDYGIDNRRGWSVQIRGSCVAGVQFVSFWKAVMTFLFPPRCYLGKECES